MSDELLKEILSEVREMKSRQDEMYQILRGLEESKEVNKAKLDNLGVEVEKFKHHKHDIILKTGEAEAVNS